MRVAEDSKSASSLPVTHISLFLLSSLSCTSVDFHNLFILTFGSGFSLSPTSRLHANSGLASDHPFYNIFVPYKVPLFKIFWWRHWGWFAVWPYSAIKNPGYVYMHLVNISLNLNYSWLKNNHSQSYLNLACAIALKIAKILTAQVLAQPFKNNCNTSAISK